MFYYRSALLGTVKRQFLLVRNASGEPQAQGKWDLMCGICLERKPTITRPLNKLEIAFSKMLTQVEVENSKKSEHELRCEADQKRLLEFKKGNISNEHVDKAVGQSGSEFEDVSLKELNAFKPASRITEADEKNDVKSTNRMLDRQLLFIINESVGKDKFWILPHDLVQEGETLRQAAERILKEKCGSTVQAKFYGNAPCGFYKYKYPKEIREKGEIVGAKIFFMKARYLKGYIQEQDSKNYSWANRKELAEHLHESYCKAVTSFLIDDEPTDLETS